MNALLVRGLIERTVKEHDVAVDLVLNWPVSLSWSPLVFVLAKNYSSL